VFALLGGFGGAELGTMMLSGLRTLAPTGVMLMFAILYFGLMIDTGLFDPLIRAILRVVRGDRVVPMLPAMAMGIAAVFGLAWLLGRREQERLGRLSLSAAATDVPPSPIVRWHLRNRMRTSCGDPSCSRSTRS
jgi:Mg2+/citrate symporter